MCGRQRHEATSTADGPETVREREGVWKQPTAAKKLTSAALTLNKRTERREQILDGIVRINSLFRYFFSSKISMQIGGRKYFDFFYFFF